MKHFIGMALAMIKQDSLHTCMQTIQHSHLFQHISMYSNMIFVGLHLPAGITKKKSLPIKLSQNNYAKRKLKLKGILPL